MASIFDWSVTAGSNSSSDSAINWAEGQAPSTVNNSARTVMGRIAEYLVDQGGANAVTGTNTLTVTVSSAFTTYANGRHLAFRAVTDNTGAVTLNVNSIGAKAIVKMDTTGDVALVSGEIQATGIYMVKYQTALNGGAGAWLLMNPTLSQAVYALASLVTTDNAVARYDGPAGKFQNSGITISDTNDIAIAGDAVMTGNIYRNVNNASLLIDGGSSAGAGAHITLAGGTHATLANKAFYDATTHTLRSKDAVTTFGTLDSTGLIVTGTMTAVQNFISSTTFAILSNSSSGTVFLRPNGSASTTGQLSLANTGNVTINGTLTVTG